jgi:hypothetical protein
LLCWSLLTFVIALLPVIFLVNSRESIYLYLPLFSLAVTLVGLTGHTALLVFRRWRFVGTGMAYVALTALFLYYWSINSRYAGYVHESVFNARAEASDIITRLKSWYPAAPEHARFYFFGLPDDLPNPDLFVLYMPRLLYGRERIESFMVSMNSEILAREKPQSDDSFYCFEFFRSVKAEGLGNTAGIGIRDRTLEFKNLWLAPQEKPVPVVLPEMVRLPGIRLKVLPAEVQAGKDTVEYQIIGMKAEAIDMLYSINGELMPPLLNWRLESGRKVRIFVDAWTPKGLYHIVGIRESGSLPANRWISVNARVRVK